MSDDVYGPEVVRIVRRYSAEVAEAMPNNTLAQAVTAVETENQEQDRQPETWRQWLRFGVPETDPDAMELQVHAREAAELWRKLKLNIESTELLEDGPPTIPTLLKAVDDAVVQWDKKREKGFGKAKSQFFSFLDTMEAHKYLFSVIPNGDKYTSLLTGIVTSVVKASTAHEQVAEGFSRALQEISKDLNFVRRGTQICNTPEVKRYVLALYSEVFAFLCHAMKWYSSSWNRFRKAFDGKFYGKHVEQTVLRIQKLVQRVHDEMKLGTDRTVQNIHTEQRMGFFETNRRIDRRFDEFGRDIDTKLDERLKAFSKLLGQQMRLTLMANAQHELDMQPQPLAIEESKSRVRVLASPTDVDECTTKSELERSIQLIAPCAENGKDDAELSSSWSRLPIVPGEVIVDIQRWVESPDSKLIWVEGPAFGPSFDNVLSSIGLQVCATAEGVDMQCVSFFAKDKYRFASRDMSMQMAGLMAMLYSLITQLVGMTRPTFRASASLTEDGFRKLDGTRQSIQVALDILRDLVSVASPGLICVISGLDKVDSHETLGTLMDMIEMFRGQSPERALKVMFVTRGNCRCLSRTTNMSQRSNATRMVLRRSSPLPGGSAVQDIRMRAGPTQDSA